MTALAALLASVACAATPVHGEPLPKSGSLSQLKWVQATPRRAGIVGMLFAYDAKIAGEPPVFSLWAGGKAPPPGPSQKILWIVRNTHAHGALVVRGRQLGHPVSFQASFMRVYDASAKPAEGLEYASIIEVPNAGCWRLDVATGGAKGSLVVQVVEP
jgi:hypothetical protein